MDLILEVAKNHLMEIIVTGFFSALLLTIRKGVQVFKIRVENEVNEQELIKQGVVSLLRFRINRLCATIEKNGEITIDCKLDLEDMYKVYKLLNQNGRTKIRVEECFKNYPIIKEKGK